MSSQPEQNGSAYEAAYRREKLARQEAEQALEHRSRELFEAQRALAEEHRLLKKAHADLQAAQAQLVQSEKMATVGQLAAGVAHEINNPVAFIKSNLWTLGEYCMLFERVLGAYRALADGMRSGGYDMLPALLDSVDTLAAGCDLDFVVTDAREIVEESSSGIERVAEIVANLRSFSRIDEEGAREVDLNECLESTLKIAWNELRYKCEVRRALSALPPVECHPGEINQVFLNLIVNACQAITGRGTITISTRAADDAVEIEVADDGCGMPEEVAARVFEPFFTTKEVGEGTGLGLSLSYAIVEKHGGWITVESEPGLGTCFTVRLPLRPSKEQAA